MTRDFSPKSSAKVYIIWQTPKSFGMKMKILSNSALPLTGHISKTDHQMFFLPWSFIKVSLG